MFEVSVRQAEEADFGAIESLINANFPRDRPIGRKTIAAWVASGGVFLVAVAPSGVVGCVRLDPKLHGLFHLVVVPELRRQGIGPMLVAATEYAAQHAGWPQVWLGVDDSTPRLIRYYTDLGYKQTGDVVAMFDPEGNEDPERKLIMMVKEFPPMSD